ncbi:Met-10+ like-protein [Cardiosporidium cionae]|uniref:tRNA (guanine(37)-N1)-methyltransferase n=1 Tax=Cardiosporidium cionae TaxID=476202 RepID=A0ABQ7JDW1_9APIC|nr:Met-10+ like-protein [Cardiosporidium cionae]|eukprot:KAF8822189.1 Met-10+ like-protein [Cardiosporidium cionae]
MLYFSVTCYMSLTAIHSPDTYCNFQSNYSSHRFVSLISLLFVVIIRLGCLYDYFSVSAVGMVPHSSKTSGIETAIKRDAEEAFLFSASNDCVRDAIKGTRKASHSDSFPTFSKQSLEKTLKVSALSVPNRSIKSATVEFKEFLLRRKNIRPVVADERREATHRLVLLNENVSHDLKDLPESLRDWLEMQEIDSIVHEVALGYETMTTEEVLRTVLPSDIAVPRSFEIIGHIAHINLQEQHLPYKNLIGEIILQKNPSLRTVINKASSLSNEYRTLDVELLAGEDNFIAEQKENGLTFLVDIQNVYWNSRLSSERSRLTESIPSDDIVCDVFAGVGAFSLYLARKGCAVLANDLNPVCADYIKKNAMKNKLSDNIRAVCMHGMDFIKYMLKNCSILDSEDIVYEGTKFSRSTAAAVHFIMNLPETALEFLDSFRDITMKSGSLRRCLLHCYCFSREREPSAEIKGRIKKSLGVLPDNIDIRKVRDVAPNKIMYCAEFVLTKALFMKTSSLTPEFNDKKRHFKGCMQESLHKETKYQRNMER